MQLTWKNLLKVLYKLNRMIWNSNIINHIFSISYRLLFSDLGQRKYPMIPAAIINMLPIHTVSIQTPIIPPTIPIINIRNNIKVLDEVGKISEAIKFADEPAGDVKKNIKQIRASSQINWSIHWDAISNTPEQP